MAAFVAVQDHRQAKSADLAQRQIGRPLAVHGPLQVGPRILPMRVRAVLDDQHLGLQGPHHSRNDGVEGRNQDVSVVPAGTAMFTDVPSAAPAPHTVGNPVNGNSESGSGVMDTVSTRGSP